MHARMCVFISAQGNGVSVDLLLRPSEPTTSQNVPPVSGTATREMERRRARLSKWLQHMCRAHEADWLWGHHTFLGPLAD